MKMMARRDVAQIRAETATKSDAMHGSGNSRQSQTMC
jgi:hypothetical protein